MKPELPLKGLRVLDLGQYIAGPLTGMMLADQGADVLKIDAPDHTFDVDERAIFDRGKRRIRLNLEAAKDRQTFLDLAADADVIIENFRPGTMARLGLDCTTLFERNPGLIFASLPGFSETDLERRDLAAWEGILGASIGLFTDINIVKLLLGLPPTYSAIPLASTYGAAHMAIAISAQLYRRQLTGAGCRIEVPLAAAGMSAMCSLAMQIEHQPTRFDIPAVPRKLKEYVLPALGRLMPSLPRGLRDALYRGVQSAVPPLIASHRCADGKWLYLFAGEHQKIPKRLLEILGLWERFVARGGYSGSPYAEAANGNNLADTANLAKAHHKALGKDLAAVFATESAGYWEERLNREGIPCSVHRTSAEWLAEQAPLTGGLTVKLSDDNVQLGPAVWLEGCRDLPSTPPIDTSKAVWSRPERFFSSAERTQDIPAIAPLKGVRVIDLATMVAGPACGRTLVELGAVVTKIDATNPMHGPRTTLWWGIDLNRGKKSLLLDLRTEAGATILTRMASSAEVLLHNFTPEAADRLGITELGGPSGPTITQVRAFDGPLGGVWADRHGYDPVLQAATGVMLRYGSPDAPEMHAIASCVDYMAGYLGAFATCLSLLKRARTGETQTAKTSLAQAVQLAQAPFMSTRTAHRGASGQDAVGESSTNRLYRCADSWIYLAAPMVNQASLLALLGTPTSLESALRHLTVSAVKQKLKRSDIAVHTIMPLQPMAGKLSAEQGSTFVFSKRNHPELGQVILIEAAQRRFEGNIAPTLSFAPKPGADSVSILEQAGLSAGEIKSAIASGAVSLALAKAYLPN